MNTVYQWVNGSKVRNLEADDAGRELSKLARRGPLTAEKIVAKAAPETSPLHPAFEWDDAEAARQHRLAQARLIMRSVVVVSESGERSPLLIHVVHEKCGGSAYLTEAAIVSDDELLAAALQEAHHALQGCLKRYHHLEALRPVWEAIEAVSV